MNLAKVTSGEAIVLPVFFNEKVLWCNFVKFNEFTLVLRRSYNTVLILTLCNILMYLKHFYCMI